jgi:hypothetical protein
MATNPSENDKKFTVSLNQFHPPSDSLRHKQERNAQPKPRLQEDCSEVEDSIQGKKS